SLYAQRALNSWQLIFLPIKWSTMLRVSVAIRSELRASIDGQFEATAFRDPNLCRHLRHQPDQASRRLGHVVFAPRAAEKEIDDARAIERGPLVRAGPDTQVLGQHRPPALAI